MTKDEALRMAIEVFDMYGNKMNSAFADEAYQACKDALAETQEPVATVSICVETNLIQVHWLNVPKDKALLYTTPPSREWQSLSDEEIIYMYNEPSSDAEMLEFAREFEAKLREKNNA